MAWKSETQKKRKAQAEAIGFELVSEPIEAQGQCVIACKTCGEKKHVFESVLMHQKKTPCKACSARQKRDRFIESARLQARIANLPEEKFYI